MKLVKKTFSNHKANTFAINFPNGNWLSTIWGWGNYCENYNRRPKNYMKDEFWSSNTVEIMFDCSEELAKKIAKRLGDDKSTGDLFSPYSYVEFKDWLWVVNQLSKESK